MAAIRRELTRRLERLEHQERQRPAGHPPIIWDNSPEHVLRVLQYLAESGAFHPAVLAQDTSGAMQRRADLYQALVEQGWYGTAPVEAEPQEQRQQPNSDDAPPPFTAAV